MNDTIQQLTGQMQQTSSTGINIWLIVTIVEFAVIVYLLLTKLNISNSKKAQIKNEVMQEGSIDFSNVLNNAFNSKEIYDDLKKKCHPDRFVDDAEREVIANELFQRITQNQHNIDNWRKLREEAVQKLGIK